MDLKSDFAQGLKVFAEDTAMVEAAKKRGMIAVKVAPDLVIFYEDVKKPWEPGGPTVVPEPLPPHRGEQQAVLPPEKHPIDVQREEQKKIDDFWNSFKK